MTPSLRRPLGILAVLVGILAYALFVVWLFEPVASLHPLIQFPIWALLGIALTSMVFARFGARLAHRLSPRRARGGGAGR